MTTVTLPLTNNQPTFLYNVGSQNNLFVNGNPTGLNRATKITYMDTVLYNNDKNAKVIIPIYLATAPTNFYATLFQSAPPSMQGSTACGGVFVVALFQNYISAYPLPFGLCYDSDPASTNFSIYARDVDKATPLKVFHDTFNDDKTHTYTSTPVFDTAGNLTAFNVGFYGDVVKGEPIFFTLKMSDILNYNAISFYQSPGGATQQTGSAFVTQFGDPNLHIYFYITYAPNAQYEFHYWFGYFPVPPPKVSAPTNITVHHYHHFM